MQPSEFFGMTPREWWAVYDVKRQDSKAGNLTMDEAEELYTLLSEAEEKANG